jgi:hypothetical protein
LSCRAPDHAHAAPAIAAAGDDIGWSGPSTELFQWWTNQVRAE